MHSKEFLFILFATVSFGTCIFGAHAKPENLKAMDQFLNEARQNIRDDTMLSDSLGQKVYAFAIDTRNDSLLARSSYILGLVNYYKGNHLVSNDYYRQALETHYAGENIRLASSLWNNMGINFEFFNEIEQAVNAYLKSLEMAIELHDSMSIYQTRINLGFLYTGLGDYEAAQKNLLLAQSYFQSINDEHHCMLVNHNLGLLYFAIRDFKKGNEAFDRALELAQSLNNEVDLINILNDRITRMFDQQNYAEILPQIKRFQTLVDQSENAFTQALLATLWGKYHMVMTRNFPKAESLLLEAENHFLSVNSVRQLGDIYLHLVQLYNQTGQTGKHDATLDKYIDHIQALFDRQSGRRIAEMRTLHEVDLKKKQMENLQLIVRQKARNNRLWIALFFISLLVTAVVLVSYLTIRQKKRALFMRNQELMKFAQAQEEMAAFSKEPNSGNGKKEVEEQFFTNLFERSKNHILKKKRYLEPSLKISDIAWELGTNEKYVSQAFSANSEKRFGQFINFYRINEAKRLLKSEVEVTLSVPDIARRSGFSSQTTFQRQFKEHTGMTPHTFRRMSMTSSPESA